MLLGAGPEPFGMEELDGTRAPLSTAADARGGEIEESTVNWIGPCGRQFVSRYYFLQN